MSGAGPTRLSGRLPDGTAWQAAVPASWNGVLVSEADLFGRPEDAAFDGWCLQAGLAIARTSREVTQWHVHHAIRNRADVHGRIESHFGRPRSVVATGASLGGLVTRALVEQGSGLADAGVAMNGGGAGTVAMWNMKLDAAFAIDVLLSEDGVDRSPLAVTARLTDPACIGTLVSRARASAAGCARLVLAAGLARQPVWPDPDRPQPAPGDLRAMAEGMTSAVDMAVAPSIRAQVEAAAGGVFTWNTDVDYASLVIGLGERGPVVTEAYAAAGISLSEDLAMLNDAPRITADPAALAWAEDNMIWSGALAGPMVTMYAVGDPAAVAEEESAYARSVSRGGSAALLQQLFLAAAGHCRYTTGERAVALTQVLAAMEGRPGWSSDAERNEVAAQIDGQSAVQPGPPPRRPAFFDHRPAAFPRPYDKWDARAGQDQEAVRCQ